MPTLSIPRHPFLRHSVSHLLCPPFILLPFLISISSLLCIALILTITPPLTPRWDDPVGPLFLTFFLIVALVVQFFVKVLTQTTQAINCLVLFCFVLIWFDLICFVLFFVSAMISFDLHFIHGEMMMDHSSDYSNCMLFTFLVTHQRWPLACPLHSHHMYY